MKIHPECIPCLFERAKFECDLAFGDNDKGKLEALQEIIHYASQHINRDTVPAMVGTERGRIISRQSKVIDPYVQLKIDSNRAGEEIIPTAKKYYESSEDKLLALMRIAAAANSMEYGVRGHDFDESRFKDTFLDILHEDLKGDVHRAKSYLNSYKKVLYILDNAGEVVLDRMVIDELSKIGKEIVVSPKSSPVINDVTADELNGLGFEKYNIVPSGSFVGVSLDEAPESFKEILFDKDYLVIAKGMGNYETISEFEEKLEGRLIYLFRAKCIPVAKSAGVKKGTLVITGM